MHSDTMEQIARQRTAEVRRTAEGYAGPAVRGPRNPIRHRTGWTLVAIGLRIAHDSGDV